MTRATLIVAIGVAILIWGMAVFGIRDEQRAAFRACQQYVTRTLRAPGSAQFPDYNDADVSDQHPFYVVRSSVDAQNGFGALLRTSYTCEVEREGEGFKLVDLKVNGK